MKTIFIPAYKDVPGADVSIQAWETEDFCNSAYNAAISDMKDALEKQGFKVKHETQS